MIDIHSHILPGIDDGARNIGHSLEMARKYVAAGYSRVVATPHAAPEDRGVSFSRSIALHVDNLNAILHEDQIPLRVLPGMEIALSPEVPRMLQSGEVIPLADGAWVLIETPFQRLPLNWEKILYELADCGYHVLIAHPERCQQLSRDPALADRMLESGACLQMNWTSLMGFHGKAVQKTARRLLLAGAIHCMATDSHDTRERSAIIVRRAAAALADLVGRRNLARLSVENPAKVLNGSPMQPLDISCLPQPAKRPGGIWGFLGWKKGRKKGLKDRSKERL